MKWPLVSRHEYELLMSSYSHSSKAWLEALEREHARYDKLFEAYHSLRAAGHEPRPVMPPRERVNPTPSDEAIAIRAAGKPALRRHLINWRDGERQKGETDEQELARRVSVWSDNGAGDES